MVDILVKIYKIILIIYCKLKILNFYFFIGFVGIVRFFGISDFKGLLSVLKGFIVILYFFESELMFFVCVI